MKHPEHHYSALSSNFPCTHHYIETPLKHPENTLNTTKPHNLPVFPTHMFVVWHIKVVLSPVDCNYCRQGVLCLDEFTRARGLCRAPR